jgi:hypothetical protein
MMTERPALFDEPTQPIARSGREAFARLSAQTPPCPGFSPARWQAVHDVCQRFLSEQADRAAAKGWTAEELFGVHPTMGVVRVDASGALMVSGGTPVQDHSPRPHQLRAGQLPAGEGRATVCSGVGLPRPSQAKRG